MMRDDHLRLSYKLCWCVVYYYDKHFTTTEEDTKRYLKLEYGISLDIAQARKFSVLFEEEIKRRGRRWVRPSPDYLSSYLSERSKSIEYLRGQFNKANDPKK